MFWYPLRIPWHTRYTVQSISMLKKIRKLTWRTIILTFSTTKLPTNYSTCYHYRCTVTLRGHLAVDLWNNLNTFAISILQRDAEFLLKFHCMNVKVKRKKKRHFILLLWFTINRNVIRKFLLMNNSNYCCRCMLYQWIFIIYKKLLINDFLLYYNHDYYFLLIF